MRFQTASGTAFGWPGTGGVRATARRSARTADLISAGRPGGQSGLDGTQGFQAVSHFKLLGPEHPDRCLSA
jgi:hypothetical protein